MKPWFKLSFAAIVFSTCLICGSYCFCQTVENSETTKAVGNNSPWVVDDDGAEGLTWPSEEDAAPLPEQEKKTNGVRLEPVSDDESEDIFTNLPGDEFDSGLEEAPASEPSPNADSTPASEPSPSATSTPATPNNPINNVEKNDWSKDAIVLAVVVLFFVIVGIVATVNVVKSIKKKAISMVVRTKEAMSKPIDYSRSKEIIVKGKEEIKVVFHSVPKGKYVVGSRTEEPGRFDSNAKQNAQTTSFSWNVNVATSNTGRQNVDETERSINVPEEFWILEYPVCQDLWKAITGDDINDHRYKRGVVFNTSVPSKPNLPMYNVSFKDVKAFLLDLNKFNETYEFAKGFVFELPFASEWECAVRAGCNNSDVYYGNLNNIAWYKDNSAEEIREVKALKSNDWGLYDMLGNVWELCLDDKNSDKNYLRGDSVDSPAKAALVLKGGSYRSPKEDCRMACGKRLLDCDDYSEIGFRIIMRRKK